MTDHDKDTDVPNFLDRRAAADFIGLSDFWLAKHKSSPDAPRYIKYGRKCYYRRADLEAWVKTRRDMIAHSSKRLDDLWEQSAERKSVEPTFERLDKRYEEEFGPGSRAYLVARAIDRVRHLKGQKLRLLINTLDALEDGAL